MTLFECSFIFLIFYYDLIHEAANNDDTESIYVLLSTSRIKKTSFLFQKCNNLTQIAIPPNINEIGEKSFSECTSLIRVSIPSSVKTIGNYAFLNCSSLKCISIPSSVTVINDYAFYDCSLLEKVTISFFTKSIEPHSFDSCISLKRVIIPPLVTKIGDYAFNCCSELRYISIPPSVKSIQKNTFKGCIYLTDLCPDFNESRSGFSGNNAVGFALFGLFLMIPIFCCLIATFISTIVWWLRIHPWFSHGYKSGKTVYISLMTCWISSLTFFILFILCILVLCFVNKVQKNQLKKLIDIFSIVIFIFFAVTSSISGIVASCYALKNDKIDGKSIKCLKYIIEGYQGANDWIANQPLEKQNDFKNWYSKMSNKAYKKNGNPSNYFCFEVGVPTLIFSIIPIAFLLYILSILLIDYIRNWCLCCC